jgi:hypothetical protein
MRGRPIEQNYVAEAIKLRVENRLSSKEISQKLNIPKSTLHGILKSYPLSQEEIHFKSKQGIIKLNHSRKKSIGTKSKYASMVNIEALSGRDKQKIAESAVLFRLCLKGFTIYGSPFDGDKADWIAENDSGKRFIIQVKWAGSFRKYGLPSIDLTCSAGKKKRRYKENEFDFIIAYCLYNDTAYVYSFPELQHLKKAVTINDQNAEAWHKLK